MTGAQTKIVFGGLEAEDAKAMAENIFVGEFDLEKPKHVFDKPTVVDFVPEWIQSEGQSEGTAFTRGHASAHGGAELVGANASTSQTTTEDGDVIALAAAQGENTNSSATWSETDTESETTSRSKSYGRHQTLRPVLATMPTQGYSLEELAHLAVVRLVNQRPRQAVVKIPGRHSMAVRVPDVPPGITAPARVERACHAALLETPYVTAAEQVQEELAERRRWLLDQARAPVLRQPQAMIMVPGRPEEPLPVAASSSQQEPEDWFE